MWPGAIPIIFAENRHWKQVPSELPFLAILVGTIFGAAINVYNQILYNRKSGGKVCPELRLPPMMLGSVLFSGGELSTVFLLIASGLFYVCFSPFLRLFL